MDATVQSTRAAGSRSTPAVGDLLLIGGVSGSGKNVALAALSDAGYYAVNNLPPALLAPTIDYLARAGQTRVAISLDARTGPGLPGLRSALDAARQSGWNATFLYLDTKTETLEKRFSETRRRHPFSTGERTLTEAIEYERELLVEARELGITFDTSELPAAALHAWIKEFVSVDRSQLTPYFRSVRLASRVTNRVGVDNDEAGAAIWVCTGRTRPWSAIWPHFKHYG